MRSKNDKLGEVLRDNGHWKYYMPVNQVGDVCCCCGKKIKEDEVVEYQIESSTGVDYYQYHIVCINVENKYYCKLQ